MTLEQLKVLVKIAETGSLLAAAAALHRTQPTVTVAIRKLEEELRVSLLDREQYRATLTAEGRLLCQQAQIILKHVTNFSTLAGHLATGHEPELHVAIEASCPMPLLLQILRDSERNYPQTAFNLQMENIRGALDRLLAAEVNLAVSPWFEDHQQLESLPLCETRLLTVAAPGYCPPAPLSLEMMRRLVQVVVRDSSQRSYPQHSFGILDAGRHWMVNDHSTKKQLILAGMGWGRLHQHLIIDEVADGRLLPLDIANYPCVLDIEIRAVRRLGEPVGPVAAALWRDFKNFARI
jgi:DNA-binding transcriptional LysR family regulator